MNWLKIVNGSATYYIQLECVDRFLVIGGNMTIYINGSPTLQLPVAAWNAGQTLDPTTFAVVGSNPFQV